MSTEVSCKKFINIINNLLDEMAPMKKLTKKEMSLKHKPWISFGILTSMKTRDKLLKDFLNETNLTKKMNYLSNTKNTETL